MHESIGNVPTQELPPQDNLRYFLDSIGYHERGNYPPLYVSIGVEGFFRGRRESIDTPGESSRLHGYIPKTKSELNTALAVGPRTEELGVSIRVDRASATKKGSPQEAVRRTYDDTVCRWKSAQEEMRIMNTARKNTDTGESVPDLEQVRSNWEVQTVMAEYFMAQEFLKEHRWPRSNGNEFKDRQRFYSGAIIALTAKDYASDVVLLSAYEQVLEGYKTRLRHLTKEVDALEQNEHVKESVSVRRDYVPGVGFVPLQELLAEDEAEGTEQEAEPEQEAISENEFTPEQETISASPFQPPQEVADKLAARREEYEQRWEELDHAGMPEGEKQARLLREFPEFTPAEEIERQLVRDIIKKASPRRGKQPRRGNPANSPWIRKQTGYDKRPDK